MLVDEFKGFIFDLDGVIYLGNQIVDGAPKVIEELQNKGKKVMYFTNNSSRTRAEVTEKLKNLGVPAEEEQVVASAYGTAHYLSENYAKRDAFVVGGPGLEKELKATGFNILSLADAPKADFVVVGMDKNFNYEKLSAAMQAILNGALFVATNTDASFPVEGGHKPGGGAMVAAISACSRKKPDLVIGKPESHLLEMVLDSMKLKASEIAIVGDRLETDIEFGNINGLHTILVLTGDVKSISGSYLPNQKPNTVLKSVKEILEK